VAASQWAVKESNWSTCQLWARVG